MGAGKFGHPGWHEDPEWKGAWGPNPPFHTPVFVLTHHPRPSIEMEGGTTFHFLDASPAEALETAREAAGGKDVRIGGGPTVIREFLAAGLVDHMHIVVVPILLGRGVRLWDGLEGLEKDYEIEATSSPSGVTHVTFTRAGGCQRRPPRSASAGWTAGRRRVDDAPMDSHPPHVTSFVHIGLVVEDLDETVRFLSLLGFDCGGPRSTAASGSTGSSASRTRRSRS